MPLPSYLFQRNQIWYFRQRIPVELVPICGCKEFKSSLKTRDAIIAKRRGVKLASRLWNQFELLQRALMKKDEENFAGLITLKDVKVGNSKLGEIQIDHQGNVEQEQATLNSLLSFINQSIEQSVPTTEKSSTDKKVVKILSEAIEEYIANKRDEVDNQSEADEKTIGATEGKLRRLVQVCGDKPVTSILRKDAEKYRNTLLKLPSNINKLKEFRGLTIEEIIDLAPTKTLSTSTVKSYIAY